MGHLAARAPAPGPPDSRGSPVQIRAPRLELSGSRPCGDAQSVPKRLKVGSPNEPIRDLFKVLFGRGVGSWLPPLPGLAREPERTGRRCRMSGARFYCGLRAWHSTTANALLFPAPVPAKPDLARGRPTSLRHSRRRVPSWESLLVAATSRLTSLPAPASQPMCGCGVSGVLRRNLRRRTRSPARR